MIYITYIFVSENERQVGQPQQLWDHRCLTFAFRYFTGKHKQIAYICINTAQVQRLKGTITFTRSPHASNFMYSTVCEQRLCEARFCSLPCIQPRHKRRAIPFSSDFTLFIPRSTHLRTGVHGSPIIGVVVIDKLNSTVIWNKTCAHALAHCLSSRMVPL